MFNIGNKETKIKKTKSREATCTGCGRIVILREYLGPGNYQCAKCRGIEIPKKAKEHKLKEERNHHAPNQG